MLRCWLGLSPGVALGLYMGSGAPRLTRQAVGGHRLNDVNAYVKQQKKIAF